MKQKNDRLPLLQHNTIPPMAPIRAERMIEIVLGKSFSQIVDETIKELQSEYRPVDAKTA